MVLLSATLLQQVNERTRERLRLKGLSPEHLEKLFGKEQLVFSWQEREYYQHRFLVEQQIQELPLFILVPKDEQALADILDLARAHHLILRPISGRHSSNYISPDVYIDMQPHFKGMALDDQQLLTIQGGETQGRVYEYLFEHNKSNPESKPNQVQAESSKTSKHEWLFDPALLTKPQRHAMATLKSTSTVTPLSCLLDPEVNGMSLSYGMALVQMPNTFAIPLHSVCIHKHLSECKESHRECHDVVAMFPGGSAGSVGVAGLTTNGGVAVFKRTVGLAVDHVDEIQLVVPADHKHPKARLVRAKRRDDSGDDHNKDSNEDLLWALCGGSAQNFGLVTQIIYHMPYIEDRIVMYSLRFPWYSSGYIESVVERWQDSVGKLPVQFNETLALFSEGLGMTEAQESGALSRAKLGCELSGLFVIPSGMSYDKAIQILKFRLALSFNAEALFAAMDAESWVDPRHLQSYRLTTYAECMRALSQARRYYPFMKPIAFFSQAKLNATQIRVGVRRVEMAAGISSAPSGLGQAKRSRLGLIDLVSRMGHPIQAVVPDKPAISGTHIWAMEAMGGMIQSRPRDSAAFWARDAKLFVETVSYWNDAIDNSKNIHWTEKTFRGLFKTRGGDGQEHKDVLFYGFPVNFVRQPNRAYWSKHGKRLMQIKQQVDPYGVLTFPQCIETRKSEAKQVDGAKN